MKHSIYIIYSLARCGGTLMSRCLGCMPGNLLLSEINPRCTYFHPLKQAHDWFHLITDEELNRFVRQQRLSYLDCIKLIDERSREQGKNLIIRDWTHVDFTPGPYPVNPVYRLTQYEQLSTDFDIHHIAIVRDPIDSFLSLSRLFEYRGGGLSVHMYMTGFRKFAESVQRIGFISYEEFCERPQETMRHVCQTLQIDYDPRFIDNFSAYSTITGENYSRKQPTTLTGEPIGLRIRRQIGRPPAREGRDSLLQQVVKNEDYMRILDLLGYPYP